MLQRLAVQAQAVAQLLELLHREDRLHILAHRVVIVNAAELRYFSTIRGSGRHGGSGVLIAGVHHAHQIFLFHHRVFANQQARNAAVLRQHQQAGGINVEATGGHQAFELAAVEEKARVVFGPAVARLDQCDGGLMAVFGLTADDAQRLVQKNGDLLGLLAFSQLVNLYLHIG